MTGKEGDPSPQMGIVSVFVSWTEWMRTSAGTLLVANMTEEL